MPCSDQQSKGVGMERRSKYAARRRLIRNAIKSGKVQFHSHVWPTVSEWLDAERVFDVEASGNLSLLQMDGRGCIDYLVTPKKGRGIFGIANRIQNPGFNGDIYSGFTLRHTKYHENGRRTRNCEYAKLREVLGMTAGTKCTRPLSRAGKRPQGLYPEYFIRSYVSDNSYEGLLYSAMVRTVDIIAYVERYHDDPRRIINIAYGDCAFYWVSATSLRKSGIEIMEFKSPKLDRYRFVDKPHPPQSTERLGLAV